MRIDTVSDLGLPRGSGGARVVVAMSGGVDSSVAAAISGEPRIEPNLRVVIGSTGSGITRGEHGAGVPEPSRAEQPPHRTTPPSAASETLPQQGCPGS